MNKMQALKSAAVVVGGDSPSSTCLIGEQMGGGSP